MGTNGISTCVCISTNTFMMTTTASYRAYTVVFNIIHFFFSFTFQLDCKLLLATHTANKFLNSLCGKKTSLPNNSNHTFSPLSLETCRLSLMSHLLPRIIFSTSADACWVQTKNITSVTTVCTHKLYYIMLHYYTYFCTT